MKLLTSTIGLKAQMAISGLILLGFVIGHMLGNLQIFLGPDTLNQYAATLHGTPALVWGTRVVLLVAVTLHIFSAFRLTRRSNLARPIGYQKRRWLGENYPARTMRWGGVILLAFIVYHLLHLTVAAPVLPAEHAAKAACITQGLEITCPNVYANVISGFTFIPVSIFYIVAQVMLGMHLAHGLWSATRTLGISNPKWSDGAEKAALGLGIVITVGNCSIPLAVMFGILV